MIPAPFDYLRAGSADEAIAALAEHGDDAKLLAGGMSLLPLMKLRLATPTVLVDVGRVRELSYIRDADDHLAVGALTRHRDLETSDVLATHCAPLRTVASEVGDNQVRHRGTIGGSLAHGDPASDLPALLLALDATVVARGPGGGERTIGARGLYTGFLETCLAPNEMLTEIRVPKLPGVGFSYQKFQRRAQDWAIVGAMAVRNGDTRIALVNMGGTPLRALAVEEALAGGASVEQAAEHAAEGTEPPGDINATPEYREHLARVLVRRALEAASA
jgi:aerobic carbon-monoxide dehydrogenase medium subunit